MPLPKPLGPYSLSTSFDRLIFVSGQGANDPATGTLAGNTVEAQTTQCLKNIQAILQAAGSDLQHVLRCGVFLVDMRADRLVDACTQAARSTCLFAVAPLPVAVVTRSAAVSSKRATANRRGGDRG